MGCTSSAKVNEEEDYTQKLGGVTGSKDITSILEEILPDELKQITEFNQKKIILIFHLVLIIILFV